MNSPTATLDLQFPVAVDYDSQPLAYLIRYINRIEYCRIERFIWVGLRVVEMNSRSAIHVLRSPMHMIRMAIIIPVSVLGIVIYKFFLKILFTVIGPIAQQIIPILILSSSRQVFPQFFLIKSSGSATL